MALVAAASSPWAHGHAVLALANLKRPNQVAEPLAFKLPQPIAATCSCSRTASHCRLSVDSGGYRLQIACPHLLSLGQAELLFSDETVMRRFVLLSDHSAPGDEPNTSRRGQRGVQCRGSLNSY